MVEHVRTCTCYVLWLAPQHTDHLNFPLTACMQIRSKEFKKYCLMGITSKYIKDKIFWSYNFLIIYIGIKSYLKEIFPSAATLPMTVIRGDDCPNFGIVMSILFLGHFDLHWPLGV